MAVLLFRADATPAMGTGHAMRCLAVAEAALEAGHACHLAAAAITPPVADRLTRAGLIVHALPGPPGGPADLAATRALAAALAAHAVAVDGYHFAPSWRAGLKDGGVRILAFDDLATAPLHADLVVNAAAGAVNLPYDRLAPGAILLLGPAHAPLRRDIREASRRPRPPVGARRTLLLTFGGSDPLGLTRPCLERLAPATGGIPDTPSEGWTPAEKVVVAVGGSDPRADAVLAAAVPFGDRVEAHHDSPAMGALMARAGLAVSAGGGTIAELAALGVPTLLVVVADNQAPAAIEATAGGWCAMIDARGGDPSRSADAPVAVLADRIAAAALALWRDPATREAMAARTAGLIDGEGAVRIARSLCAGLPA